jgi:hypothetical protein
MVENVIISINTLSHFGDALLGNLVGFLFSAFFFKLINACFHLC